MLENDGRRGIFYLCDDAISKHWPHILYTSRHGLTQCVFRRSKIQIAWIIRVGLAEFEKRAHDLEFFGLRLGTLRSRGGRSVCFLIGSLSIFDVTAEFREPRKRRRIRLHVLSIALILNGLVLS